MLEALMPKPTAAKAETIPQRRIFMTGSGKPAQPKFVAGFCNAVVSEVMDGWEDADSSFALGFAACLDAISRGTFGAIDYPLDVVSQAWRDVNDVSGAPGKVTNFMREYFAVVPESCVLE